MSIPNTIHIKKCCLNRRDVFFCLKDKLFYYFGTVLKAIPDASFLSILDLSLLYQMACYVPISRYRNNNITKATTPAITAKHNNINSIFSIPKVLLGRFSIPFQHNYNCWIRLVTAAAMVGLEQNLFCASGHGAPPQAGRASEKSEPKIPRWGIFGAFAKAPPNGCSTNFVVLAYSTVNP